MTGFFQSSAVQKERSGGLVPRCGACGLFKTCESPKMGVYGKGEREVLVIGEAPGKTEDEEGRPFIGKAGLFLRQTLDHLDVDLDRDAWTTNALICRPPKNKTPDARQISYCRPNVRKAIARTEPRVVVLLGKSALTSLMERYWKGDIGAVERWVGWRIPCQDHWICPTYHPAFLIRMKNPLMDRLFSDHLRAAFSIERDPPKQPDFHKRIRLVYSDAEVRQWLKRIDDEGGWVVVDYETNCIKPEWPKARIVSCAISNGRETISYPWSGDAIEVTGLFLRSKRTRKIAANLKFEERWTRATFGHGVVNWGWDTMLASHCLDNRPGICSLKFQAFVKLGIPTYNENVEPYLTNKEGPYNRIREIDLATLLFYGGTDALLEYHLAIRQRREMGYED